MLKATREDSQEAVEHFNQAIALDPNYALAYAGLADLYRIGFLHLPTNVALQKQRESARRELELDDTRAESRISRMTPATEHRKLPAGPCGCGHGLLKLAHDAGSRA